VVGPVPLPPVEPLPPIVEVRETAIALTDAGDAPVPLPPVEPEPAAQAPMEPAPAKKVPAKPVPAQPPAEDPSVSEVERVRSLNKPVQSIALVEPVDLEGRRPADLASELSRDEKTLVLTGSWFCMAHPARYTYCFSHNPLYFEDANLERCGIGHGCCQPVCSAAQFIGRTAILPWSLVANPPCGCETTLGDCPTCHAYPWGVELHR
jgi:hypothetical protein